MPSNHNVAAALLLVAAATATSAPIPNYSKDIAPILNRNCVSCHRPGEIGPMPLRTYSEVRPWAKALTNSVQKRHMPPWDADPAIGNFKNDRRLAQSDIDAIVAWSRAGAPEGDPKTAPPQPVFATGWAIPKPDLVIQLPEERIISPTGPDEYVKILVDPGIKKDLWVKGVELRPGNRKVVHHAHVFLVLPNPPAAAGARPPSPFIREDGLQVINPSAPIIDDGCAHPSGGYLIGRNHGESQTLLASFVPGMSPDIWPDGIAKRIPAGSKLLFDIHYSKITGKEERDRSMVGFVLTSQPPRVELQRIEAMNFYFAIPPGAERHQVTACVTAPADIDVLSLLGHMHYRGKGFRIEVIPPGAPAKTLLHVPNYNFDWQEMYRLAEPARIPKGTVIRMTAWFDNSPNNKANPDPSKQVRWGEHTRTEMMDAWIEFVAAQTAK